MNPTTSNYETKIINCLGDSTTWGDNGLDSGSNEISWVQQIQDFIPFQTTRNYGKRGSRIAITTDRTDSFVERYPSMDDKADYITIMGGVNDFQHSVPLGNFYSKNLATFYGALNNLIPGVINKYPQSEIIFITPTKNNFKSKSKNYPNSFQKNEVGLIQNDYVNAIKHICNLYSVPIIDLYNESGISPFIEKHIELYTPDGLHFNKLGYRKLAARIAHELKKYI